MSLTADAINRLLELVKAADQRPATDTPTIVLPGGCVIANLEKYMAQPASMRCAYKTDRIDDFCQYVAGEAIKEQTAIFVGSNGAAAEAIIDYGSHAAPRWMNHRASLGLNITPEFAGLMAVCGKDITQRDLIDYMEDWGGLMIAPYDGDKEITLLSAMAAIRNVEISQKASTAHQETNFEIKRAAMEEVGVKSNNGSLPSHFEIKCALYLDPSMRTIITRLSMLTGNDKPKFRLRIVCLDTLKKDVALEVQGQIKAHFVEKARVFIGDIAK